MGSCVGIAFYWPEKRSGALAHCLLPDAPEPSTQINARYVSQAIPSLMALLKIREADIAQIRVCVAGGANMMPQQPRAGGYEVGARNIETALSLLSEKGFQVRRVEVGGEKGRQIQIDCDSGEFTVKELAKL